MLFISRNVVGGMYGVVDTDDGIEEVHPWADIVQSVIANDISIMGVSTGLLAGTRVVVDVLPYQLPEELTPIQVKTNLIRHVSVTTYGPVITSVRWREHEFDGPVALRLSDFGKLCADCILLRNGSLHGKFDKPGMTFILDDRITLSPDTFTLRSRNSSAIGVESQLGVAVDVREVTRQDTIETVYSHLSNRSIINYVIDNGRRKCEMLNMESQFYNEMMHRLDG